jgi:SAM-dependent methyltransferase
MAVRDWRVRKLAGAAYRWVYFPPAARQWARQVMERETLALVRGIARPGMKVLELSGDKWGRLNLFEDYTSTSYPEYDICGEPLGTRFDLIIAEQVFEHLPWPYRAGRNVWRMLNPDGYFLITTPFLIRVHEGPLDCSRWTDVGLKYFLAECGFPLEGIRSASWGNRACVIANFSRWVRYKKWIHSLKNEPAFPAVVWALGRK